VTVGERERLSAPMEADRSGHEKALELLPRLAIRLAVLKPSAFFEPGQRNERKFRLGQDHMDSYGTEESVGSMEDYALPGGCAGAATTSAGSDSRGY